MAVESSTEGVVRIQKLGEQIQRIVGSRIINGAIPVGTFAPSEQEICREFDVSKTVAREIIAALATRGLIDVRQGRRNEVLPDDRWDLLDPLILELHSDLAVIDRIVSDMHEVRMILEPEVAARAASRVTDGQLAELEAALAQMKELRGTPERFEADVAFHLVLARAAGNRILVRIMESLRSLMRVSVQRRAEWYARGSGGTDPHRAIYEAIEARDPEAAREQMRKHMLAATKIWVSEGAARASNS